jgi:hypothetical protein
MISASVSHSGYPPAIAHLAKTEADVIFHPLNRDKHGRGEERLIFPELVQNHSPIETSSVVRHLQLEA